MAKKTKDWSLMTIVTGNGEVRFYEFPEVDSLNVSIAIDAVKNKYSDIEKYGGLVDVKVYVVDGILGLVKHKTDMNGNCEYIQENDSNFRVLK